MHPNHRPPHVRQLRPDAACFGAGGGGTDVGVALYPSGMPAPPIGENRSPPPIPIPIPTFLRCTCPQPVDTSPSPPHTPPQPLAPRTAASPSSPSRFAPPLLRTDPLDPPHSREALFSPHGLRYISFVDSFPPQFSRGVTDYLPERGGGGGDGPGQGPGARNTLEGTAAGEA